MIPNEIMVHIMDYCPSEDLMAFRLVNQIYCDCAEGVLLKRAPRELIDLFKDKIPPLNLGIRPKFWKQFTMFLLANDKQINEQKASLKGKIRLSSGADAIYHLKAKELDEIANLRQKCQIDMTPEKVKHIMRCILNFPKPLISKSVAQPDAYRMRLEVVGFNKKTRQEELLIKQAQGNSKEWKLNGELTPFQDLNPKNNELTVTDSEGTVPQWKIIQRLYSLVREKNLSVTTHQAKECRLISLEEVVQDS